MCVRWGEKRDRGTDQCGSVINDHPQYEQVVVLESAFIRAESEWRVDHCGPVQIFHSKFLFLALTNIFIFIIMIRRLPNTKVDDFLTTSLRVVVKKERYFYGQADQKG